MAKMNVIGKEYWYFNGGYGRIEHQGFGKLGDLRVLPTRMDVVWERGRLHSVFEPQRLMSKGLITTPCLDVKDILWMVYIPKEHLLDRLTYRIIPYEKNIIEHEYVESKGLKISIVAKKVLLTSWDCDSFKYTKSSPVELTLEHNNLDIGCYHFHQIQFNQLVASDEGFLLGFRIEKNTDEGLKMFDISPRIEFIIDGDEYYSPAHTV